MTDTTTTDTTTTTTDTPDTYMELRTEAAALLNDENSWTFMDQDPSVAWGDPESGHGRLAAIYERAGYERCYHDGSLFHFNVKVSGNAAYRALHDAVRESGLNFDGVMEHVTSISEMDLESWWTFSFMDDEIYDATDTPQDVTVWQCGRSGGYMQPDARHYMDSDVMIALAQHADTARDWFNSGQYGGELAEQAIEAYNEQKMTDMASPRIERIEA